MGDAWVDALVPVAPDIVAAWRGIEEGRRDEVEGLVRAAAGDGTAVGARRRRDLVSPMRPDLVDCWVFRVVLSARDVASIDVLLLRRAPGRLLPGLWQCVSGSLEEDDRVAVGALRELREETSLGPDAIEAFYDLDLVNQFHEPSYDAIVTAAVFAVRVRKDAEPTLSAEHDESRWVHLDDALAEVIWPGYRTAIERIRDDLSEPDRAEWFELTLDGARKQRRPIA